MSLDISQIKDEKKLADFLRGISDLFGVGLKIESADEKPVFSFFNGQVIEPLQKSTRSALIVHQGEVAGRLNLYDRTVDGNEPASANLELIEKAVMDKLMDHYNTSFLKAELVSSISERDLYKKLAEEVLQHETRMESFDVLLKNVESILKVKRCGIFILDKNKENLELIAYRCGGCMSKEKGSVFPLEKTPFGKVVQELKPLLKTGPCEMALLPGDGSEDIPTGGSTMAAPLIRRREGRSPEVFGVIFVCEPYDDRDEFTTSDLSVISTLASISSVTQQHFDTLETSMHAQAEMDYMVKDLMSTFEALQQKTALIEQVNRISVRINSMLDLDTIFDTIADYSKNLLMCSMAMVGFISREGKITFKGASGIKRKNLPEEITLEDHPVFVKTFEGKKGVIVNKYSADIHRFGVSLKEDIRNFITSPIEGMEGVVAVIVVLNKEKDEMFDEVDAELLQTLAGQGQTAIENARLLEGIKQTQVTMMAKLAELAEKRDPETGEHLLRMQRYCRVLARGLSKTEKYSRILNEHFINEIYTASPLHDIGKVGIYDEVLLKPGKLDVKEFEVMKTHAAIGAEILKGPDYLQMACDIAWAHHEKWNGSGYPRGLKGELIPLSARIVAVADVYDALTSKRVYKEGFSHEKAMDIIRKDSGTHFDKFIVETMEDCIEEFLNIKENFQ